MTQKQIIINIPEVNTDKLQNLKTWLKPIAIGFVAIGLAIGLLWGIGGYRASQFALGNAGLSSNAVSRLSFEFDMEGFTPTYEIEWYNNAMKQEYKVHAFSGNILEIDWD